MHQLSNTHAGSNIWRWSNITNQTMFSPMLCGKQSVAYQNVLHCNALSYEATSWPTNSVFTATHPARPRHWSFHVFGCTLDMYVWWTLILVSCSGFFSDFWNNIFKHGPHRSRAKVHVMTPQTCAEKNICHPQADPCCRLN